MNACTVSLRASTPESVSGDGMHRGSQHCELLRKGWGMAPWVGASPALAEDLILVPSTVIGLLRTI